jgi:iron complex outermembrane receptor protein
LKNLFAALIALLLPVLASAQFSISGKITESSRRSLARRNRNYRNHTRL